MNKSKSYEERKAEKFVFSLIFEESSKRESDLSCTDCNFYGLNRSDDHVFSITERDDKKGFGVNMVGVHVVPSSFLCVENPPRWLIWVTSKLWRVQKPTVAGDQISAT